MTPYKLRAVIRIEQDGTPALFYIDDVSGALVCFTFTEGHTTADMSYFSDKTLGLNRHAEWMYYADKIQAIRDKFAAYYAPEVELDFKLTLGV